MEDEFETGWIRLAAATANVKTFLELCKEKEIWDDEYCRHQRDEKTKADQHRETVERRLAELARFERDLGRRQKKRGSMF